jgi:hypothetical protein
MEGWKSIYIYTPKDQQKVACRRSGEDGYTGNATYDARTATFRTYQDKGNRMVITVWKCDEWKASKEIKGEIDNP